MTVERTVLAIDPGTDKCGMALVRRDAGGKIDVLWRAVSPRDRILDGIRSAAEVARHGMIVIGRGTGSKAVVKEISDAMPGEALLLVDEKDTSWAARERYWEHHPRRGWRRLLPASLQTPPAPVDDFVALILAERVLLAS